MYTMLKDILLSYITTSARNGKFHETERCIVQNIGAFRWQ